MYISHDCLHLVSVGSDSLSQHGSFLTNRAGYLISRNLFWWWLPYAIWSSGQRNSVSIWGCLFGARSRDQTSDRCSVSVHCITIGRSLYDGSLQIDGFGACYCTWTRIPEEEWAHEGGGRLLSGCNRNATASGTLAQEAFIVAVELIQSLYETLSCAPVTSLSLWLLQHYALWRTGCFHMNELINGFYV